MKNLFWIFRLVMICLLISGCKREDPTPEVSDMIYIDLKRDVEAHEKAVEELKKKLVEAQKNLDKSQPRTIDRRSARDEVVKYTNAITRAEEALEYSKIRLNRRFAETRHAYKKAFRENTPWPSPGEYEYYQINKKLRAAPRTWTERLSTIMEQQKKELSSAAPAGEK